MNQEIQTKSVRLTPGQLTKLQRLISEELYIAQAARKLGVSRQTIHRIIALGRCNPKTARKIDSINLIVNL